MKTTIIVPTYNEAENIPELVERLKQFVKPRDIFVVDDNSPDGTASIAANLGCRVLLRHRDKGLSAAVVDGLKHVSEGKVVIMDADLQHPPELVPRLLKALDRRDIAVASRYYRGGGTEGWSGKRKLVSMVANLLGRPFAPEVKDRMSGFFAIRREAVPPLETLNTGGFKILFEILARSSDATTVEIPYTFVGRRHGESKLKSTQITDYLKQLANLLGIGGQGNLKKAALGILISIGLIVFLLTRMDLSKFVAQFGVLGFGKSWLLILAVISYTLTFRWRRIRWSILLGNLTKAPKAALHKALVTAYALNFVLPVRLGEVVRTLHISRKYGGNWKGIGGSVLTAKILDLVWLVVLVLISLSYVGVLPSFGYGLAFLAVIGVISFCRFSKKFSSVIVGIVGKRFPRLGSIIDDASYSLGRISGFGSSAKVSGLTLMIWTQEFIAYYLIAIAFGLHNVVGLYMLIPWVIAITGITNILQATPSGPGSFGTFEAFGAIGLLLMGVALETAVAYVLFLHILLSGSMFIWGLTYILRGEIPLVSAKRVEEPVVTPAKPLTLIEREYGE